MNKLTDKLAKNWTKEDSNLLVVRIRELLVKPERTREEYIEFSKKSSFLYYEKEIKAVTDQEYDFIMDEFADKYPGDPYLDEVGFFDEDSSEDSVETNSVMTSLKKDPLPKLKIWYQKNGASKELFWSEKLDGISVKLTYENGNLTKAVLRRNQTVAYDITGNVLKTCVPKTIPYLKKIELRGELILENADYDKFFKDMKNPRSAVNAIRNQLNDRCKYFKILFYKVLGSEEKFETEEEMFLFTSNLKLPMPKWGKCKNMEEVVEIWQSYENGKREQSPYEMDGLVVVINQISSQVKLGIVGNRPRYARAYKFTARSGVTVLLSVIWQVGRTRRITPVGQIRPILIGGATLSEASLHNVTRVKEMNIKIGDEIEVKRSGDVIPKIESIILSHDGPSVKIPNQCPACQGPVAMDGAFLICANEDRCLGQDIQSFIHWVSTLGVLGFGEKIIEKLVKAGLLKELDDFYKLSQEDIAGLDQSGDKTAERLLKELQMKSKVNLPTFIFALGIPGVGLGLVELAMEKYPTLAELEKADFETLISIKGIGESKAQSLIQGLKDKKSVIQRLCSHIEILYKTTGTLAGKIFCFTGFRDKNLEKTISSQGGKISGGVNKSLSYLVVEDLAHDSKKTDAANKLGIKIIDIETLNRMLTN